MLNGQFVEASWQAEVEEDCLRAQSTKPCNLQENLRVVSQADRAAMGAVPSGLAPATCSARPQSLLFSETVESMSRRLRTERSLPRRSLRQSDTPPRRRFS